VSCSSLNPNIIYINSYISQQGSFQLYKKKETLIFPCSFRLISSALSQWKRL